MIGVFVNQLIVVFIGFVFLYIFLNIRKPLIVELIGDESAQDKRASVLSIDSQLTSIFIILFAPILGFISDEFSYGHTFIFVGITMVVIYLVSLIRKPKTA